MKDQNEFLNELFDLWLEEYGWIDQLYNEFHGDVDEWLQFIEVPVFSNGRGLTEPDQIRFYQWLRHRPEVPLIQRAVQERDVFHAFIEAKGSFILLTSRERRMVGIRHGYAYRRMTGRICRLQCFITRSMPPVAMY